MAWYGALEPLVRRDVPLAGRTTFRIGGTAAFLLAPPDEGTFAAAYSAAVRAGLPVYVLGAGSNVLISDEGVPGVVLSTSRLRTWNLDAAGTSLRVGAGMRLAKLVRWTARAGLSGLECLAGIPGTVGGAVRMNAGTRDGAIGERVDAVRCAAADGSVFMRRGGEVKWRYRNAEISHPIVGVELRLESGRPRTIGERIRATLAARCRSQPVDEASAGCFFRNPPGTSAGRLIERTGLKGARVGLACVSPVHANFIVNRGGATAADVLNLSADVRERVRARFGVLLESEVCCWPNEAQTGR